MHNINYSVEKVARLLEADPKTTLTDMVEILVTLASEQVGDLVTNADLRGMKSVPNLLTKNQLATFDRHPEIDAWLMKGGELQPLCDKEAVTRAVISLIR